MAKRHRQSHSILLYYISEIQMSAEKKTDWMKLQFSDMVWCEHVRGADWSTPWHFVDRNTTKSVVTEHSVPFSVRIGGKKRLKPSKSWKKGELTALQPASTQQRTHDGYFRYSRITFYINDFLIFRTCDTMNGNCRSANVQNELRKHIFTCTREIKRGRWLAYLP